MKLVHYTFIVGGILAVIVVGTSLVMSPFRQDVYSSDQEARVTVQVPPPFVVTHIKTPIPLKAVYMSSWVAGNEPLRSKMLDLINTTELNAIVIDIKDYTGKIAFMPEDPELLKMGSAEKRVADMKEFIGRLHDKNIYVIGRISAFQDSYLIQTHPQYAVKTESTGAVWRDYKGVGWLDAGSEEVWKYLSRIGDEAYSIGFDEINFDYIRFPSDGNMKDIAYPYSEGKSKREVLKSFFAYVDTYFRPKGVPISADLFGMTTSNSDDLGIGQIFEHALMHFDFVAPMIYPSHYPPNFNGWKSPASMPYEIIHYALEKAMSKARVASTTPAKIRPWLQDFSIGGVVYTPDMVRLQKQATYDVGLTSWMMWNASNKYTYAAYDLSTSTSPQRP